MMGTLCQVNLRYINKGDNLSHHVPMGKESERDRIFSIKILCKLYLQVYKLTLLDLKISANNHP